LRVPRRRTRSTRSRYARMEMGWKVWGH